MRDRLTVCTVVLGILAAATAALAGGDKEVGPAVDPLIVHEWGTFTSMSGGDGTGLEGLQHEEEALPSFVYSRTEVRDCPLRKLGWKGLEVPASHVTRKMETPVIYVHSKTRRSLRVRVDMVGGLITQWYPVTDLLGPPELGCDEGALDLRKVTRSFLEWDVDVVPPGETVSTPLPEVAADDPWAYAREVDCATLVTKPRKPPEREGPVEAERYLFYRGLGTFTLPFEGRALGKARALFRNTSAQRVDQVVTLEVGPRGETARYDIACYVPAQGKVEADLSQDALAPIDQVLPALESDVHKILRGQGLHDDEARAMVRTWSRSWFRTEGLRFIYTVPRPVTDAILPLTLTPAPDRLVRALVGRLEMITPEVRAEVETALREAAFRHKETRASAEARERAEARLARLGRFLEPHLRDILATTPDAELKGLAAARLAAPAEASR